MNNPYLISVGVVAVLLLGAVLISGVTTNNESAEKITSSADGTEIVVYKDPSCGCCGTYVSYLRDAGFEVDVKERTDMQQVKNEHGVSDEVASCHTAEIAGYTVEGHVPHEVVSTLLSEKPAIEGIALAGMPSGAPGMQGEKEEPFTITTLSGTLYKQY